MSPFNFQPVQTLAIAKEDKPHIDVRDGQLILTAERNNERIMITAPLNSVLPKIASTSVKAPGKHNKARILKGAKLPVTDSRVGQRSKMSKLTEQDVREMRALAADKDYQSEFGSLHEMYHAIGKVYKIHFTTVYNIVTRRSWKHLAD